MQQSFRKSSLFNGLIVALLVVGAHRWFASLPDRVPRADAVAAVRFDAVAIDQAGFAPLKLAGAWAVTADDLRMGGVSALSVDSGGLVALSDSGVVIRLPRPSVASATATFHDLPSGPGNDWRKPNRDSEALTLLNDGAWLVAFENRDQVWRYDRDFRVGWPVVDLQAEHMRTNRGIEAMALHEGKLLLIPEGAEMVLAVANGAERTPLASRGWTIGDVAALPDGRMIAAVRRLTPFGIRTGIGWLERDGAKFRLGVVTRLPLARFGNAEAIAAETLPGGAIRLWVMTDNDFRRRMPTMLIALDVTP